MLIACDGACKRNGQPSCASAGVAWIQTDDGKMLYKSKFETCSTSQRGEIYGLLEGLKYAVDNIAAFEDVIIITDSEYLYNTVSLDWCHKWKRNGWYNADGNVTKNADLWEQCCNLLDNLNKDGDRVYMQWTKGHCIHYTPGNTKVAMLFDSSGVELYSRVTTMANRIADRKNIIDRFLKERKEHNQSETPEHIALEWAIANTMADLIATYVVTVFDSLYV